MSDHKIEDIPISIQQAFHLAQQLSKRADPSQNGKVNLQRLVNGLNLMRGSLNCLKEKFDVEKNRTLLSTAGLSSTEEVLAEFDAVVRGIEEAVGYPHHDKPVDGGHLSESTANALLAQLDGIHSRVLLVLRVICYAAQIQTGEDKSMLQRQEGDIRALVDRETIIEKYYEASASEYTTAASQATNSFQSLDFKGYSNETVQNSSPEAPTNTPDPRRVVTESKKKKDLVIVGIDFGGTSSAAAFALADSNIKEPKVLDRWPESVQWSIDGVPRKEQIQSTLYYSPSLKVGGWGEDKYEAVSAYTTSYGQTRGRQPQAGIQAFRDVKSALVPPTDVDLYFPLPPGRLAADLAADYLWHLRQSVASQIKDRLGGHPGNIRYVITVPASWDEKAQKQLRKVAKMAGFWIQSNEELALVPGPEAALLYADFIDPSAFEVGDNILVVDCGGHLVEAATYEIKSKDPLGAEKCTDVSVASCGSAEVTRRFMSIVDSKIKKMGLSDLNKAKIRVRAKCRSQFEKYVKLEFGRPDFHAPPDIPRGCWAADVGLEIEVPEADLEEGYMMFSEEEIYSCFDPAIERTMELIGEQVTAVRTQEKRLQTCLLVGGFNKCAYYTQGIQARVAAHGIRIIQPDLLLSFVKGAVLAGLRDIREVSRLEGNIEGSKVRDLVMKWTTLSQEQMTAL
ncbi:hypothetical protein V495_06641 [Pseudogymnoascus sp. VKM F-4514 (FW-929)]|nr:hypothetical protein V495_06641 [Pseudogymnoascus sp. VKM F-4514 (FW-929)]KFY56176.1 hypothetical protein V497_06472 [Pseudogymnoascus sp. VKM F-4516 (FW-969)]